MLFPSSKRMLLAVLVIAAGWLGTQAAKAQPYGWSHMVSAEWTYKKGGDGGQCIAVPGASRTAGTVLVMQGCGTGDNQYFRLKEDNLASTHIAVYSGGEERCLNWGQKDVLEKVFIDLCANAPQWEIRVDGRMRPLNDPGENNDASCLAVHPIEGHLVLDYCYYNESDFGTNWRLPKLLYDQTPFKPVSNPNTCLDIRGISKAPGASVLLYACNRGPNQTYQMRGAHSDQILITVYQDRDMLCVANMGEDKIRTVPCNARDVRQLWHLGLVDPVYGLYSVVNFGTSRCLDASAHSWDALGWPCNGGRNQEWIVY